MGFQSQRLFTTTRKSSTLGRRRRSLSVTRYKLPTLKWLKAAATWKNPTLKSWGFWYMCMIIFAAFLCVGGESKACSWMEARVRLGGGSHWLIQPRFRSRNFQERGRFHHWRHDSKQEACSSILRTWLIEYKKKTNSWLVWLCDLSLKKILKFIVVSSIFWFGCCSILLKKTLCEETKKEAASLLKITKELRKGNTVNFCLVIDLLEIIKLTEQNLDQNNWIYRTQDPNKNWKKCLQFKSEQD